MRQALLRAIVGDVIPLKKDDEIPVLYRQTLPAPLASSVSEAETPITDVQNQPSTS